MSDAPGADGLLVEPEHTLIRRGLAWGMTNSLALRLGNLLFGVVLARLLAPEQFGIFAVALTAQTILVTFSELGMTADLVRRGEIGRRGPTVATLGVGTSVVAALVTIVVAKPLATALGSAEATNLLRVLALTLVLAGASAVPAAVMQKEYRQRGQFGVDVASFVVNALVVLVLIALGQGAMALAWARLVAQFVATVLIYRLSRTSPRLGWDRAVARDVLTFGLPLCGANFLSWVLLNLDYVVVGRMLGAISLGLYVLAFNISSWPMNALASTLRAVGLPAFAEDGVSPAAAGARLVTSSRLTLFVSLPVGAALAVLAPAVVRSLYGEAWDAAAGALASLAVFGAVRPVTDLWATFLTARGETRGLLVIQVLWGIALLPALVLCCLRWGIVGVGVAHVLVTLLVVVPGYLVLLRRRGLDVSHFLRAASAPTILALVVGVAAWMVSRGDAQWSTFIIGGLLSGAVWAAAMLLVLRRDGISLRGQRRPAFTPDREGSLL